jgi:hypothetical protein
LIVYKGRLLSADIIVDGRQWRALDTMAFFPISLEAACERLRLPVRKRPRPAYLGERAPTASEWPEFDQYARTDALATYELGRFIVRAHQEFGLEPTVSVAQMAERVFAARFYRRRLPALEADPGPMLIERASRAAYHGGKNGLYAPSGVYEDVAEVDIISAYPHALSELPPLTQGRWSRVKAVVPGLAGVYRVRGEVTGYCPYGVFLRPDRKGPVKVHEGPFDLWTTGWELAMATDEIQAELIDGYVWIPSRDATNPFKAYVETFFRRKQDTPRDNPLREVYKLLLNALYGKLNQPSSPLANPFWAAHRL